MARVLDSELVPLEEITPEQGLVMLDEQARTRLGMTGEEFLRAWDSGQFQNGAESPEVTSVALLLPFARRNGSGP